MASKEPGQIFAGDAQRPAQVGAEGHEGGLEALGFQVVPGDVAAEAGVVADLDAFLLDELGLPVDDVTRQPVLGDADVHHASRHGQIFEDHRSVAAAGQDSSRRRVRPARPR